MATVGLLLALGLVNWFATLLVVESEFFRPVRAWISRHASNARRRRDNAQTRIGWWFWRALAYGRGRVDFMINCHMCAGTWVGFFMVPFAPMVFGTGITGWVLTGLLIKALGHGVLVLHKLGEERTRQHKYAANQLRGPLTGEEVNELRKLIANDVRS